ncbi:MAG: hypothetical protein LW850_33430 [Planctomycetaceae bacterium]|nr:hypothetical protein [Planctomycetaceae bacterium]
MGRSHENARRGGVGWEKSRNHYARVAPNYDRNIDPAKAQDTRMGLDVPKKSVGVLHF